MTDEEEEQGRGRRERNVARDFDAISLRMMRGMAAATRDYFADDLQHVSVYVTAEILERQLGALCDDAESASAT